MTETPSAQTTQTAMAQLPEAVADAAIQWAARKAAVQEESNG
jgi:hypothetical protein